MSDKCKTVQSLRYISFKTVPLWIYTLLSATAEFNFIWKITVGVADAIPMNIRNHKQFTPEDQCT
jgi:hypothetical protein